MLKTMTDGSQLLSLEECANEHGAKLYRYAVARVRNAAQADDLVQETLLAAWHSRKRFAGRSSPQTWLIGILKHKIMDYFRSQKREVPLDDAGENFDGSAEMPDNVILWPPHPRKALEAKEFETRVRECLSRLKPRQRQVFILRVFEMKDVDETADILNMSTSNVCVCLHRARIKLR